MSDCGRVRTKFAGKSGYQKEYKILNPLDNGKGYLRFNWKSNGKNRTVYVHRLVAEAFLDNPKGYNEVNHIDENKRNNNSHNLEWCSHIENCNHGTRNERTAKMRQKEIVCVENGIHYKSIKEAAKEMGVGITAIANCLKGRAKTSCGFHWRYNEI